MKIAYFAIAFLVSSVSFAKTFGSAEQKKEFAAVAITNFLKDNNSDLTLVPNSVDIESCEGFTEKLNKVLGAVVGGSTECKIATFYVITSEAKMFSGKMFITSGPKEEKSLFGFKRKSSIPALDIRFAEMKDPKTNEAIYMGLHSMSTKQIGGADSGTTEEILNLERVNGAAIKKSKDNSGVK